MRNAAGRVLAMGMLGNTPRPSSGQGQAAIRRRAIGGLSGLARVVDNAPNTRHRSLSAVCLRP